MNDDDQLQLYFERNIATLMRYALSLLANSRTTKTEAVDEAQDAVQNTLEAVWKIRQQIKTRDNEKVILQYLFTTLRHECLRRMKTPNSQADISLAEVDRIMSDPSAFPGSREHIDALEVRKAILALKEPHRRIIIGRYYERKSFQDMADELKIERSQLYKLNAAALTMLQRILTIDALVQDEPEDGRNEGAGDMRP